MTMQTALRRSPHLPAHTQRFGQLATWLAFAVLAACTLHLCWPSAAAGDDTGEAATVSASSLVHWKDAKHDWLLVVDDQANQLVVYDAVDGRPVQRLNAKVVGNVATLAQRDGRLFVIDVDGTRKELQLPQLQRVAANVR
ncbi:MAG TPA: hypothetical protein VNZ27_11145 [Rhodanobacter sp.]|jgi:hypothetical protein|nr:hypothetical protein [Rhodanobacter sp.]